MNELSDLLPQPDKADALLCLEIHFQDRLLVDAGNVETAATAATQLRLRVDRHDCAMVLDEVAKRQLVIVTLDMVEEVINDLFGWDRFIEP